MEAAEITFGINTFLSLIFGLGGALGVWFKLKGKVDIMQSELNNLEERDEKLHSRIDNLKGEVKENREKGDHSVQEVKEAMNKMEIRIIEAIHKIKTND